MYLNSQAGHLTDKLYRHYFLKHAELRLHFTLSPVQSAAIGIITEYGLLSL